MAFVSVSVIVGVSVSVSVLVRVSVLAFGAVGIQFELACKITAESSLASRAASPLLSASLNI